MTEPCGESPIRTCAKGLLAEMQKAALGNLLALAQARNEPVLAEYVLPMLQDIFNDPQVAEALRACGWLKAARPAKDVQK